LEKLAKRYNIPYTSCKKLENAVDIIAEKLDKNEVALLSPASASFDQFDSYKHRGEEFIKFIKNI